MKLLVGDYEMIEDYDTDMSAEPLLAYIMEAGKDNDNIIWRSKPGDARASFRVPISGTTRGYWICLQNSSHGPDNHGEEPEHPDHKIRLVGFSFRVVDLHERPAPLVFTNEHGEEWLDKSGAVEHEMRILENHQEYMRIREENHRAVVEATFGSTLAWTITEAVIVVAMAVGQVMYFRGFLERKTFL